MGHSGGAAREADGADAAAVVSSPSEGGAGEGGDAGEGGGSEGTGVDIVELYRDHSSAVRRSLLRSGRHTDAEDLTHDAFERTISHKARLDGSQSGARAYLYAITGNLVRDRWRREGRAKAGNVRLRDREPMSADGADVIALGRLEEASIRAVFEDLDRVQRDVLRLRVVEGRSSAEVAEMLGRTPEAVRQIQHRALATLRGRLEANGWVSGSKQNDRTSQPEREQS